MATIEGTISLDDRPEDRRPCVWCGEQTSTRALAPFLDPPRMVPLDVLCAGAIIVAFRRRREGRLTDGGVAQLEAYARRLAALGPGGSA